jgi:hypothetical protein
MPVVVAQGFTSVGSSLLGGPPIAVRVRLEQRRGNELRQRIVCDISEPIECSDFLRSSGHRLISVGRYL